MYLSTDLADQVDAMHTIGKMYSTDFLRTILPSISESEADSIVEKAYDMDQNSERRDINNGVEIGDYCISISSGYLDDLYVYKCDYYTRDFYAIYREDDPDVNRLVRYSMK